MALGYCMVCDTLWTIRPGPQKWGSRECDWFPQPHWVRIHLGCGEIVDGDNCVKCGPLLDIQTEVERCPGEKKAIK